MLEERGLRRHAPIEPVTLGSQLIAPVHVYWPRSQNGASITGGYVDRGPGRPRRLLRVCDFVSGRIAAFRVENGVAVNFTNLGDRIVPNFGSINQIVSFAVDGLQNLYVVSFSGNVYRLNPSPDRPMV